MAAPDRARARRDPAHIKGRVPLTTERARPRRTTSPRAAWGVAAEGRAGDNRLRGVVSLTSVLPRDRLDEDHREIDDASRPCGNDQLPSRAGGHGKLGTKLGDSLVAFVVP